MGNDISVVELRSMNNDQIHRFAALVNEPENTLANMSDDPVRIETYPGIGPQIISYRKSCELTIMCLPPCSVQILRRRLRHRMTLPGFTRKGQVILMSAYRPRT